MSRVSWQLAGKLKETKTMTKSKTISSLSIVAIAWLMAAVPSFGQSQSNREAQSSIATQAGDQVIGSNTELIARKKVGTATPPAFVVERSRVKTVIPTVSPLMLSTSTVKRHFNFNASTSGRFVSSQLVFKDGPKDPHARKQFRWDDDDFSGRGRKLVSFIPSRGQKLPE